MWSTPQNFKPNLTIWVGVFGLNKSSSLSTQMALLSTSSISTVKLTLPCSKQDAKASAFASSAALVSISKLGETTRWWLSVSRVHFPQVQWFVSYLSKTTFEFDSVMYAPLLHKKVMALATINSVAATNTICSNLGEIPTHCATVKGGIANHCMWCISWKSCRHPLLSACGHSLFWVQDLH